MNAFSVGGVFMPLTVTDRLIAEPPAFGVALAHVWPSEHDAAGAVEVAPSGASPRSGSRRGRRYTQVRLGPDGPRVVEVAARLGGGHDAELCRAALGVDLNALALAAALGEAVRDLATVCCKASAGRRGVRRLPRRRPRASSGPSRGSTRRARSRACSRCASTGGPATSSGRCGAAPTARARSSRRERAARRRSRALAARRRAYASRSMSAPSGTRRLGFQPPAIGEEEIAAVAETLRSGWLTTGPRAAELEERMPAYLEAEHVLAVASGTAAMHLAPRRARDRPGRRGDHDPDHLARDRERDRPRGRDTGLRRRPRRRPEHRPGARGSRSSDERTKAILPVHLAGQPCDLDPLLALGLPVVEDAAHAAESRYRGRKVGGRPPRPASRSTRRRTSPPARAA